MSDIDAPSLRSQRGLSSFAAIDGLTKISNDRDRSLEMLSKSANRNRSTHFFYMVCLFVFFLFVLAVATRYRVLCCYRVFRPGKGFVGSLLFLLLLLVLLLALLVLLLRSDWR